MLAANEGGGAGVSRGPTVSIVIPVFNRADLTQSCLEALAVTTAGDFEVLVVDNGSTDWTADLLARFGSAITVIRNAENEGFARACNAGARASGGDYLVFLNNDTLPRQGWLEALLTAAEADPDVGIVGARLLYPDGTIQHAGIGLSPDLEPFHLHQGASGDALPVTSDRDCEAVTGACLLVPRVLFWEVGGFDECYRMYFEDVDLCLRVRAAGRRVRYAAASVLVHLERASSASFGAAFALNRASRERFRARWATPRASAQTAMRVLFQARPTLLTHPGGDTVVVRSLARALEALGVEVRLGSEPEVPAGTDVVHTINFATPEITQRFANGAERARVPLVATALYEDWPLFLGLARAAARFFATALGGSATAAGGSVDRAALCAALAQARALPRPAPAPNEVTVSIARMLFACGDSERQRLLADYPAAREVRVVPFGADQHLPHGRESGEAFAAKYGVRDYVLCVARLEPRKNQLMLLEALRDDPRPVVLVAGGFTYCPDYAALCRLVRRRGPTLVLERLSPAMLAAAFREAAVHCLPSWYELPGLVSLEAAFHGARVAASGWGAIADYLGDSVAYLEPDEPESICRTIATALALPPEPAAARARACTWERAAAATLAAYEEVIPLARRGHVSGARRLGARPSDARSAAKRPVSRPDGIADPSAYRIDARSESAPCGPGTGRFSRPTHDSDGLPGASQDGWVGPVAVTGGTPIQPAARESCEELLAEARCARERGDYATLLAQAERAARAGADADATRELRAVALARLGRLDEAEGEFTALLASMLHRRGAELGLGVVALERGDLAAADAWLERAVASGGGADAWAILGLCRARRARAEEAWQAFATARDRDPAHRVALHGLITIAEELQRLGELEGHLRDYLTRVGDDADVRCALAGCLCAAGRVAESRAAVRELLARAPGHPLAARLAQEIGAGAWRG